MIYRCCDLLRREETRASALNGIDFLEVIDHAAPVEADRQRFLHVHLLKDPAPVVYAGDQITVTGPSGVIEVLDVQTGLGSQANVLVVELTAAGDFETHVLAIRRGLLDDRPPPELDPQLASVAFSFKVECPSDFDCLKSCGCVPDVPALPEFSYLARDIDSFRTVMLDRIATLQPGMPPPNPVDQRMAIIDALAVVADRIAYAQDAGHTAGWLAHVQDRISARRLALLVDYRMDEGRNARCFVHLTAASDALPVAPDFDPVVMAGTAFATRIGGEDVRLTGAATLDRARVVFEAMTPLQALFVDHNEMGFHTWSDQRCSLPAGATSATLSGHFPNLQIGDFLGFEEVVGPRTGNPADRDRANRQVVRLIAVNAFETAGVPLTDPVTTEEITEIAWDPADALDRPLCLSAETALEFGRIYLPRVSVARGNIVLADHGRSILDEDIGDVPGSTKSWAPGRGPERAAGAGKVGPCCECEEDPPERMPGRFAPVLAKGPLTFAVPLDAALGARALLAAQGLPAPQLWPTGVIGAVVEPWTAQRDLLGSGPAARDVVAEIDSAGRAHLRFGNDVNGQRPAAGVSFSARYRIGQGPTGNIGEDRLVHVLGGPAEIAALRNFTAGVGGIAAETIRSMRRRAPFAFRRQDRAVNRPDHDEIARRFLPPEGPLQGSVTDVMHTGSWHTTLLTVDRRGGLAVDPDFETDLRAHIEPYRMAGRDIEVEGPIYVPIEIDLEICVCRGHLSGQVKAALADVFSARVLPDGSLGAFHPDRMELGRTLYLSPLVALAQRVQGVCGVTAILFRRFNDPGSSGLGAGRLLFGRREVAQLQNDPSHPGRGVLRLRMKGGR
ncbi:hypothetical protein RGQ15_21475 [Paracoccus sp. MBLB3053]|uniref:Baseplate assembly protein n=1 Tax=Paracoccus aurantius TaxID=3073814 RepID=A0ABU2HYI9_9RHOB|nr:hypothetical protein [Paracoccus sp. MBLB3053]MDS9470127.1 hypothetical protein [Paracoccus sp. MBLB3053]